MPKVVIATGSRWRRDGVGRHHTRPIAIDQEACVLTPDDLMVGRLPAGLRVVVWDDDHYYMGGVLAELCAERGFETWYVTPACEASTADAPPRAAFHPDAPLARGVRIQAYRAVTEVRRGAVVTACVFTDARETLAADAVVLVTARLPEDTLAHELERQRSRLGRCGNRVARRHRRRIGAGHHRACDICRAPVCRRVRRQAHWPALRPCRFGARDHRARWTCPNLPYRSIPGLV